MTMTRCLFCRGPVQPGVVQHVHEWGERVVIFKYVPAEVCQQCGEAYFSPDVLKQMDKLAQRNDKAVAKVTVPVYSLAKLKRA